MTRPKRKPRKIVVWAVVDESGEIVRDRTLREINGAELVRLIQEDDFRVVRCKAVLR